MQPADDHLPNGVEVTEVGNGRFQPSAHLSKLLAESRSNYDWPAGTGAAKSQAVIISLEKRVADLMQFLDESSAHEIIMKVSEWAGNNVKAHRTIATASQNQKKKMFDSFVALANKGLPRNALDSLANLPGIGLVIATKIYRFCCPAVGAAVDRHASYFFNSLDIVFSGQCKRKALAFRREWATGSKSTSRLATYTPSGYSWNRDQYIDQYLPFLSSIANSLNESKVPLVCAATGKQMVWRPADVEMSAYYWWACNGAR
jgi:hypothetical protein